MWHNSYFLVPALLLFAAALYAAQAKRAAKRVPSPKGLPGRGLPLLDTAFLAGGPGRVFDTAFVRMHRDGRAVLNRAGLVTLTGTLAFDAVDQAVIEAAGPSRSGELGALRRAVMRSAAVQEIGDRLADRGLLRDPVRLRRARSARRLLWIALLDVVVFAVAAYLLDSDEPGYDRPALWAPLVMLGFGLFSLPASWPLKGRITPAGRRQLTLMNTGKPWKPSDRPAPLHARDATLLGAVALGGLTTAELADEQLREAMLASAAADQAARSAAHTGAGSSSSSSSGSSSSSCGTAGTWCGSSSDSGSSGSGCGGSSGCGSSSGGSSSSSCGSSSGSSCSSSSSCGGGGGGCGS
ncbi:TIGR04222 domain-containing membrane protein [Kitasatospora sp. NPDC058406]|uniref:TIGR04222 domain-containing membrane protein n=1 Tax=Kitasatospora sp. NPDC058406 TaxID=3346483 RepID=UPI003666E089